MADRRAELEQKRQKLESMRQSRNEQKAKSGLLGGVSSGETPLGNSSRDNKLAAADDILLSLGISDLPSSASNTGSDLRVPQSMTSSALSGTDAFVTPSQSFVVPPGSDVSSSIVSSKRRTQLSMTAVQTTVIQPKESITYSKEVQTLPTTPTSNELVMAVGEGRQQKSAFDYYATSSRISSPKFFSNFEWDDEFDSHTATVLAYDGDDDDLPHHHHNVHHSNSEYELAPTSLLQSQSVDVPSVKQTQQTRGGSPHSQEETALPVREFSEEERSQIMGSERFSSFVMRASRVLERALTQPDVCVDYTRDMSASASAATSDEVFSTATTFSEERAGSRHRLVTAVDFSPINPELVLASYCDHSDSGVADPQGLVLVWNSKFSGSAPEFVFHAESPVRAACFAPFHPNLIVGATYSGQVVLWDTRLPRKTPANRTPLSSQAHTHPIYCLKVVGTQNANNLISLSSDGRLCSWTLDMFSAPQETLDLTHKQKPVNAVCAAFLDNDPNNFVVGAEDGALYTACRHGNKQGVLEQFEHSHHFNVTALDTHCARGPIDFSNLVLTASNDWAVRLWSTRSPKCYIEQFREGQDSSTDVKWSPLHPALFASADASGRVYLYDLNSNCEVPVANVVVESGRALVKRIAWHPSGQQLAAGTESGLLHVYNINEATATPRADDWQLFSSSVRMMTASADDRLHATPIGQVPASLLSSVGSTALGSAGSNVVVPSPAAAATSPLLGGSSAASTASVSSVSSHLLGSANASHF